MTAGQILRQWQKHQITFICWWRTRTYQQGYEGKQIVRIKNAGMTKALVAVSVIGGMSFAGMSAGNAAPAPTVVSPISSNYSGVVLVSAGSTPTTGFGVAGSVSPSSLPSLSGSQAAPQAVPIAVRLAVRAAMEVLKRTSTTWYNAVRAMLNQGRTAFVNWWNNSVPSNIKNVIYTVTGGISGNALYDALLWVFGLN